MKLSEKFARQESEETRLARIARRRISKERMQSVRRLLGPQADEGAPAIPPSAPLRCEACGRGFRLPMHLGRHRKSKHSDVFVA
jgi:hypothetical protein